MLKEVEIYKNVYIGLGSNLGDRRRNISMALEYLKSTPDLKVCRTSKLYETDPVGVKEQQKFLNMVIAIKTLKEPAELLKTLQHIELALKRIRDVRWGPRTIDLDILLYDDIFMHLDELEIPHPRMFERAFVLIPLRDIWHGDKNILDNYIKKCEDIKGVKVLGHL